MSRSQTYRTNRSTAQTPRRVAGKSQIRSYHASQQETREQDEIHARLSALDKETELWDPDAAIDNEESADDPVLDSDVSMDDEDEISPEETSTEDNPSNWESDIHLVIHQGKALIQPPDWNLGYDPDPNGWLAERSCRFDMLGQLANWLNTERKECLQNPGSEARPDIFLNFSLSKTDLNAPLPVLENGLFELTNAAAKIADYTTFHRHIQHAVLRWPKFELRVVELTSHRSQVAWVAAAIQDLKKARRFNLDLLRDGVTPPGNAKDKKKLLDRIPANNPHTASPDDYARAACLMTGVAWDAVVQTYGTLIFSNANIQTI